MKKTIWVFSLTMLLFSTFAPSFTYANEVEDEAKEILMESILETESNYTNNSLSNLVNSNEDRTINTVSWLECFDYSYTAQGTLSLMKYKCESNDIIIPTSESWASYTTTIKDGAFDWKTINSIVFPETCLLNSEAFSWTTFNGNITIREDISVSSFLSWFTVSENGVLTIKTSTRLEHIINDWKIIYDMNDYKELHNINTISADYLFTDSIINWEIDIFGLYSLSSSFNGTIITDKWKVKLWSWINILISNFSKTDYYPNTQINWLIELPDTVTTIDSSFNNITIPKWIELPNAVNYMNYCFYKSSIWSWLKIPQNINLTNQSFLDTIISWSVVFSWTTMQWSFPPSLISWDFQIQNSNLKGAIFGRWWKILWDVNIINTTTKNLEYYFFSWTIISWDFNIIWDSFDITQSISFRPKIWWNLYISWDKINLKWLTLWKITWDVNILWNDIDISYWIKVDIWNSITISWNNIIWKYWSLNINASWDVNMIWNTINAWYTFMDNSKIDWNFNLKSDFFRCEYWCFQGVSIKWNTNITWNTIELEYSSFSNWNYTWDFNIYSENLLVNGNVLNGLNINWNFRLPKNIQVWFNSLSWYTVGHNLILEWAKTVIPSNFTLNWWLIIEDWNEAIPNIFTWLTIWNNQVTINWTLSNIWAHAYSFKEWTRIINTITLADDFSTWDIWDWAFCIQNEPEIKVNAVTTKRFTQEEKQDLYDRTCVNLTYNWVYYLTLDIDWEKEVVVYDWNNLGIQNPTKNWYEFIWWFETWATDPFDFVNTPITEDKTFYAHWKALEEKAEETTAGSVVYTNGTTVTIWDDVQEEPINNLSLINLVSKEVDTEEVKTEEEKITIQESEIQVTSGNTVEYQGWLKVYLEKRENVWTENETTERIEWTAKFSSPVAIKIPITSNTEAVKVKVKHEWENFWYTWLTLNPINSCSNWESVNDKYNWENISVKDANGEKFVLIYTCSASTFVAYTENTKQSNNTTSISSPAAWGGRTIKQESKTVEQEHNSADTEKPGNTTTDNVKSSNSTSSENLKEQVIKVQERSLTRWEVAVMTNILLDVYPQLTNNRELNEVSEACENYADEQNFTKDEKKAITRLCKLSIMWIHADNNKPLDEFMVNEITKNDEFSKVINRSLSTYTEKDFSVVKEALKKLEWDEENVVFGTVYDVFMSIKNVFSK